MEEHDFQPFFTNECNLISEDILKIFEDKLTPFFEKLEPAKIYDLVNRSEVFHEMRDCLKTVIYEKEFFDLANTYLLPIINNIAIEHKHIFEFIPSHVDLIKYHKENYFNPHIDFVSNHTNFTKQYTLLIGFNTIDEGETYIWDKNINDFKPFKETVTRGGMVWFCSDIKHFADKIKKNNTKIVLSFQLKAIKIEDEFNYENTVILKPSDKNDIEYYIPKNLIQNTLFEVMIQNNDSDLISKSEQNNIIRIETNLENDKLLKIIQYLKKEKDFSVEELEDIRTILNFYMINHVQFMDFKIPSKYLQYLNENFVDKDYILFNRFEPWMVEWAKEMNYIPFQIILHFKDTEPNNIKNTYHKNLLKQLSKFTDNYYSFWDNINNYLEKSKKILNQTHSLNNNMSEENLNKNNIFSILNKTSFDFLEFKNIKTHFTLNFFSQNDYYEDYDDYDYEMNNYYYDFYEYDDFCLDKLFNGYEESKPIDIFKEESKNINTYCNYLHSNNENDIKQNKFKFKNISKEDIYINLNNKYKNIKYYIEFIQKNLTKYNLNFDNFSLDDKYEYLLMQECFGDNFNYPHFKSLNFNIQTLFIFSQNDFHYHTKFKRMSFYENLTNLDKHDIPYDDKFMDFEKNSFQINIDKLKLKYGDVIQKNDKFIEILTTINNGELLFGTNNFSIIAQIINSYQKKDNSNIALLDKLKSIIHMYQYLQFNYFDKININHHIHLFLDDAFFKLELLYNFMDIDIVNDLLNIRFNNFCNYLLYKNPFLVNNKYPKLENVNIHDNNSSEEFYRYHNIDFDNDKNNTFNSDLSEKNNSYFESHFDLNIDDKKRIFKVINNLDNKSAIAFRDNIKYLYSYEESGCNDDGGDIYHEYENYHFNIFYVYFGFLKNKNH